MRILVEHLGEHIEVDVLKSVCPCDDRNCEGFALAKDILLNQGKFFRYDCISSFHKSLRRGHLEEITRWAQVYVAISGLKNLVKYCEGIALEESRSIRVSQLFYESKDPLVKLNALFGVKKKWNLDYYKASFETWLQAFKSFCAAEQISIQNFRKKLLRFSTLDEGYELVFQSKSKSEFKQAFWEEMARRAFLDQNVMLTEFLLLKPKAFYARLLAVELCVGYWQEEADEIPDIPNWNTELTVVPKLESWAHDVHSRRGKRWFIENFSTLAAGTLSPVEAISLAWSGQVWGIAHRFGYIDLANLSKDLERLQSVAQFDAWFYPRTYEKILRTSRNLPFDPLAR